MFSKYLLNWSIKGHQGSKLFIKTAPSPKEASHSLTLHTPLCRRRTALAGRSISYPQCSALVVRFPNEVPSYTSSLPDILVFSLCWQFSSRFAQGAMVFFFFFSCHTSLDLSDPSPDCVQKTRTGTGGWVVGKWCYLSTNEPSHPQFLV